MDIFPSTGCNSINIKDAYEGLDFEQEQGRMATQFYCEVIQHPDFIHDPESYLKAWVQEVETLGSNEFASHELEVLRRLRKIFEV